MVKTDFFLTTERLIKLNWFAVVKANKWTHLLCPQSICSSKKNGEEKTGEKWKINSCNSPKKTNEKYKKNNWFSIGLVYFCRASLRGEANNSQTSADLDVVLGERECCITTRWPFFVTKPSLSTSTAVCRPWLPLSPSLSFDGDAFPSSASELGSFFASILIEKFRNCSINPSKVCVWIKRFFSSNIPDYFENGIAERRWISMNNDTFFVQFYKMYRM